MRQQVRAIRPRLIAQIQRCCRPSRSRRSNESGDVYGLALVQIPTRSLPQFGLAVKSGSGTGSRGTLIMNSKSPPVRMEEETRGKRSQLPSVPRTTWLCRVTLATTKVRLGMSSLLFGTPIPAWYLKGLTVDSTCEGVSFTPDGSRLLQTVYNGTSPVRAILYDTTSWLPVWHWDLKSVSPQSVTANQPRTGALPPLELLT